VTEVLRPRRPWWTALGVAVVVQLVAVYAPSGGGAPPFPNADKIVHAAIFAAPVVFGVLAGLRPLLVVGVVAVHAPVSELVQWSLLPQRDGDVWDAVADLGGVALGWLLARWLTRSR
jgi:uncharacterized membrane protein